MILAYFIKQHLIAEAVIYAILSGVLLKWKSRISAILLFLLSAGTLTTTFFNWLDIITKGGHNFFLALIMLAVAFRAVEATFKLHKEKV